MPRNSASDAIEAIAGPMPRLWRKLLLALILGFLALNLGVYLMLVRPAGDRARAQRDNFDRLRSELQSRRANISRLRGIAGNLGSTRKQVDSFYEEKFLPQATGFSTIMEELDKLARANNVHKGGVSYDLNEVPGRSDINQVDMNTTLEGDYGNIVRFINSVERSGLFLIIDTIAVGGGTQAVGQLRTIRLSLRLVTFFRT